MASTKLCLACDREFSTEETLCPYDGAHLVGLSGDPLIGANVENVKLEKRLASGRWSNVYRGTDNATGETVAVKVLLKDRETAQSNAKMLAALSHPGIVRMRSVSVCSAGASKHLCQIMDFVGTSNLAQILATQGNLPPVQCREIVKQLVDVLAYLEAVNHPHPDLKSGHVVISDQADLKVTLVDFTARGLLHSNSTIALGETTVVDVIWAAPEMLLKGKPASAASNIYSLGVIAFEALSGVPPFRGVNSIETAGKQLSQPVPRLKDMRPGLQVPRQAEDAIRWALEKEPEKRPASAAAFADAFCEALA